MTDWGKLTAERLTEIAKCSEAGPGVTRLPFTREHADALQLIEGWMQDAGLETHLDAAGTLVGRTTFPGASQTLYMGSHQDSVRHGGAYDGIMGVALPILALKKLKDEGITLPFNVEILAFADEEGVRFPTALIGSRALAGSYDPAVLDLKDRDGISIDQAMRAFGLSPDNIPKLKRNNNRALGFVEVHIEQGPMLQDEDLSLGVVTAICGIERHSVTFHGVSGHAGTLPMRNRQDALVGASKLISYVNELAVNTEHLRATVGALDISPNVVNAVPNEARLTVEMRSADDAVRAEAAQQIEDKAKEIAETNRLTVSYDKTYAQPAQQCADSLRSPLAEAVKAQLGRALALPSGATHDASAMADLGPMAMMFVRCKDGISHNPAEYASPEDMGDAVQVLAQFIKNMAVRV
ncbi:M20 family metallo-hydrolase [Maritalea mediterranea]|uniref:M20 family metallo-hydrolase n=1 Tax=Maritalea mediterranea TaxID=2909667 RepID=A0ABS9E8P2_9HYPH|nr:M20 family metallo-hydrolase [Maritalea mediterranea]MCF4099216.1 M20 family metallo-hydrolase [Maritalea mediterranea]